MRLVVLVGFAPEKHRKVCQIIVIEKPTSGSETINVNEFSLIFIEERHRQGIIKTTFDFLRQNIFYSFQLNQIIKVINFFNTLRPFLLMFYNRHGQSAALQVIFVALEPFSVL